MQLKEITQNLQNLIDDHLTFVIPACKKYRKIAENKLGQMSKKRIIRTLRLNDEIVDMLSPNGEIYRKTNNKYELVEGVTFDDILVEETIPSATIDALKAFSVGSKPSVTMEDQEWLQKFETREDIHNKLKELVQEMLIVGDSFFKIEFIEGVAQITILYKENIILVPDSFNKTRLGAIIYFENRKKENSLNAEDYNYVEIYFPNGEGYIFTDEEERKKFKRKNFDRKKEDINLNINRLHIFHIKGLKTVRGTLYSHSIFKGCINDLIELIVRDTSNSFLFNKVNNPTIVSSEDFSEIDVQSGERSYQNGKFLVANDKEGADSIRYIEPPTSHVATIYPHIERTINKIYAHLGVNEISLGLSKVGGIASGEAFKKAITVTLKKCEDITSSLQGPLFNLYKIAYLLEKGSEQNFEIKFSDGIPLSEKEIIDNRAKLINLKLVSRLTILKEMGYTEEEAKKELERIAEEENILNPPLDLVDIE